MQRKSLKIAILQFNLMTTSGQYNTVLFYHGHMVTYILYTECLYKLSYPLYTVVPLIEAILSNMAKNLCHYYYECIYFSLPPPATSIMRPQFSGK